MPSLDSILHQRLEDLERAQLRRQLHPVAATGPAWLETPRGKWLNFASNDYLGLSQHPEVISAGVNAWNRFGTGSGASRLISGSLAPHHALEDALAIFEQTESARCFSSGYAAALGTLPALVGPGDFILLDRLVHACLIDGARLSRARLRVFRHNDLADLERILAWATQRRALNPVTGKPANVLVVTESVFSMDGDAAPLAGIADLARQHDAWLFVDEAHATGVLGPRRRGLIDALGLKGRVDVHMGTLGKALGSVGGFIAGSRALTEYLLNRARSFVFSTAPPAAPSAAALAALRIIDSREGEERAARLWQRIHELHQGLQTLGWTLPMPAAAILPIPVGPEADALSLARALAEEGIYVPAIRYPTVARGEARLRLTASAAHTAEDTAFVLAALKKALERTGIRPPTPSP